MTGLLFELSIVIITINGAPKNQLSLFLVQPIGLSLNMHPESAVSAAPVNVIPVRTTAERQWLCLWAQRHMENKNVHLRFYINQVARYHLQPYFGRMKICSLHRSQHADIKRIRFTISYKIMA